jgi:dTDP-4-amino-4,6-dideoxygalactose transaminase
MRKIVMVDLKSQYDKIKKDVDVAIQSVIDSTQFIKGNLVKEFQSNLEKYLGVNHVITCGNGTDALQIALMALDLKPGDEIITTNFTFIATVEVIALLGLKPILVDVDYDTFTIDVDKVKEAITSKTKAIVPVHLFGQCANMNEIMDIATDNNLFVIEDNAQAIGADYTYQNQQVKAGTVGHIGCTSFFPSKNLGCFGDGGALFTNDDKIADRISKIVNHGMKVRYYHDIIGVNSRLDTIQAAVLNIKLNHLDEYCKARLDVAEYYNQSFKSIEDLETPVTGSDTTHVFHQYTLKVKNGKRDDLKKWLESKDIPAMIYYPVPLNKQKAFAGYSDATKEYPVTDKLTDSVLSLPIHTEMDNEQLEYIVKQVKEFFNK